MVVWCDGRVSGQVDLRFRRGIARHAPWALPRSAIVPQYVDMGTVERSPLATIDELGVGELVRIAVDRGRAARPGLDYVSCSPFRVPIARVAAAQAAIAAPGSKQ